MKGSSKSGSKGKKPDVKADPAPKPPHPSKLMPTIRRLTREGEVYPTEHVLNERMPERDISLADLYYVLEFGEIVGDVSEGDEPGEWKCLVVGKLDWTNRECGAVTVVSNGTELIIVTVEWMDR